MPDETTPETSGNLLPESGSNEAKPSLLVLLRKEVKASPLAALGVLAAIVALIPIIISAVGAFGDEPIRVENSPVAFSSGQFTSPNLVIPRPLAELSRPPNYDGTNPSGFMRWARRNGAVYADEVALSFVAKSDLDEATYIVGARVTVLRREAPMKGTWIAPDGAGPQADRLLFVNLDTSPPGLSKEAGWDFPLRISNKEDELFTVLAEASTCHCFWQLELDVLSPDNEKVTVVVDDHGVPFELTGSKAATDRTAIPYEDSHSWPR